MGNIKGNTTLVKIADKTLVSQRNLSWSISDSMLAIAGQSGKSKNRKPSKRYGMQVSLSGLYDPDNPDNSLDLLMARITNKEIVKVVTGNDLKGYRMFLGYIDNISEEMNQNILTTYQASIVSSSTYASIIVPWILADGTWNDDGVWKDFEIWNDN